MKTRFILALATVALVGSGCAEKVSGPVTLPELTSLPRALSASEQKVLSASNAFSMSLWREVNASDADENVFISPLSASFALGMTMNGAKGTTYDEMHHAMKFDGLSLAEINEGYRSLIGLLLSLDAGVQMKVANSIWYRNDFPFHPEFFDMTRKYFDAASSALDFADQQASLATINGWVSNATNGRIPSILNSIDPDHVMFLINAIYFKGSWRQRFDPARTFSGTFKGLKGDRPAQFMNRSGVLAMRGSNYTAVELPYGNGAFVMNVILPDADAGIEAFAAGIPEEALTSSSYRSDLAELQLPKLRFSYEKRLNDQLKALGMRVPFGEGPADFTGLSPAGRQLYIDFVKQNTFVDINEEGTEAAAVTVVSIIRTSAAPRIVVDRPYLFVIRERLSGTILFMGKVVDMPA